MIQVQNLTKYFGPVLAVDHISFEVGKGEIVGFLGPNGAGKSTTMRILTTFLPATSGIASVAGFDVMNQSMDVRRNIGYLPESVPLYPEMRVEEYLVYRAKLKGVDRKVRPEAHRVVPGALPHPRSAPPADRHPVQGLSPARRPGRRHDPRPGHPHPRRADHRPRPDPDPRDAALIRELGPSTPSCSRPHILSEVEAVCERVIIIHSGRLGLDRRMAELGRDTAVIVLEVRGPAEKVAKVLKTTDDVAKVDSRSLGDGLTAFEIVPEHDRDLRELIFQRVAKNGWTIRRLDLRQRKLEDHFIEVVVREQDKYRSAVEPKPTAIQEPKSA